MIFKIVKVDDQSRLKKLGKIKKSFLSKKKDDISLFHYQEVKKDMFHTVFHLNDEYLMGTKKIGNQTSVPFSQYINFFFFNNSGFCLIENTDSVYLNEIKNYISKKAQEEIQEYKLSKDDFGNIVNRLGGFIKKIEYSDGEDDFEKDFASIDDFNLINKDYLIDYVSLNNNEYFISIYKSGKVSVSNSDEDYLINFAEVIVDELDKRSS
ncbi:hypothetical protein ABGT22_19700 [Peribacillus frigoritolerans]|uniref:hypothetical protein n=1 Tax=Peribacillus frigoritolerans TaxID=450367 RepID=UPI00345CD778